MRFTLAVIALLCSVSSVNAQNATSRSQAHWMLERLTGVKWPSTSPIIDQMAQALSAGDRKGAAELATSQPQFLNVVVRQLALKMSTREETIRENFNDFAASFIGITRDNSDARELLHGNFYYTADPSKLNGATIRSDLMADIIGSNNHYNDLGRSNLDVGQVLMRVDGQKIAGVTTLTVVGTSGQPTTTQTIEPVNSPDPAGVLTSRTFMAAHATAGTNRRLVEYTFRQFMCLPIQGWADTLGSDVRVGRDVDRLPGGDNNKFLTTCKGCHAVQDGFRGAFAKYDWRDNIQNVGSAILHVDNGATGGGLRGNIVNATAGVTTGVMFKMNRPDFVQYAGGYVSTDDSFVNNANRGANASLLGWRSPAPDVSPLSGRTQGVHAFGRLIAGSQRFSRCMAQRVWAEVCHTEYSDGEMDAIYASLALEFEGSLNYKLRGLFETVALHPKCRR
jgi:hypothetical protein